MVELAIVMTIVAILMAISIPSYKYVTNSNRIAAEINGLLGDMQYARAEAIKEGQTVTVCVSSNAASAAPTCTGGTSWQNGWIVFADVNGDQQVTAGTDTVLRQQAPFTSTDTFVANNTLTAVTFNREGFPVTSTAAANTADQTWRLHATPTNNQSTRCIKVGLNGQVLSEIYGVGVCT